LEQAVQALLPGFVDLGKEAQERLQVHPPAALEPAACRAV